MELSPRSNLKVMLIGNYCLDEQESMERFALMLWADLQRQGLSARIIKPKPYLARLKIMPRYINKWLGYIDKFILFPDHLKKELDWADVIHVCDHSNALYIKYLKHKPHLITIHDLLAVRSGLGEQTYCPLTRMGKHLQKMILAGLKQASMIVCDSKATRSDAERLITVDPNRLRVIHLGLNYPFQLIAEQESNLRIKKFLGYVFSEPFLLHVGSSQLRKNRHGIMQIFAKIKDHFKGSLVFAGSPLSNALKSLSKDLGIEDRIIEIIKPDNDLLEALYNRAFALIYPSLSEGFGWPIIEAQACGCPVICSDSGPCPEVAGLGAIVHPVSDHDGFAKSILDLIDLDLRTQLIKAGFENLKAFSTQKTVSAYKDIYEELLQPSITASKSC